MIPVLDTLIEPIQPTVYYDKTRKITIEKPLNRVIGYAYEIESLKQAIYLILSTERYMFPIYSWDYGVELRDLFGQPIPYCRSEIPRRVTDALLQDNRVLNVRDFEFDEPRRHTLATRFIVDSIYGPLTTELEVEV